MLDRVVDNLFNGSASSLMMQLLGDKKMSPEEMEEFKELIRKIDQKPLDHEHTVLGAVYFGCTPYRPPA